METEYSVPGLYSIERNCSDHFYVRGFQSTLKLMLTSHHLLIRLHEISRPLLGFSLAPAIRDSLRKLLSHNCYCQASYEGEEDPVRALDADSGHSSILRNGSL